MRALCQPSKRTAIKDEILRWIAVQQLAPGDRILSQNQLAVHFKTTAVTVHKALTELSAEGVLVRRKGQGTFIGARAATTTVRRLCLLLPGEHLDDPTYNPHYWPYVQQILRAFMQSAGTRWTFSTRAVAPGESPAAVAAELTGVDAVFFHHTQEPRAVLEYLLAEQRLPVVCMGKPKPWLNGLTVDHDQTAATRRGIAYLAELGCQRIGFVGSDQHWGDIAWTGYQTGLRDFGLPAIPALTARVGEPQREGFRGAAMVLTQRPRVDAIVVDSDMRALGALEYCRQTGIRVPEDLCVLGYDGLDYAHHQPPHLTTIEIPYRRMFTDALRRIEAAPGQPTPTEHLSYIGDVLPGRTCAARLAAPVLSPA